MAGRLVKKGKLFLDIFPSSALQQTFEAHRDLKSCLSLQWAEKIFKTNPRLYLSEEKTALLEYLNNYPLSYDNKVEGVKSNLY